MQRVYQKRNIKEVKLVKVSIRSRLTNENKGCNRF